MFSWERGPIGHRAGRPNTLGTICRPSSAFAACPTSIGTNRGVRHMKANRKLTKCDSGMALVTTLLLLVLLSSLLVGFFVLVTTGQQLTGGARQETRAFYGADRKSTRLNSSHQIIS